tara:strand:+ start:23 stop:481 length:459 start_codon:yes stop_codon:yes gene_type:complete
MSKIDELMETSPGYAYEDFKSQDYEEPGWLKWLYDFTQGVTPSRQKLAHSEIDKLIENAPANVPIAKISREARADAFFDLYRVLMPDSTIKLDLAHANRFNRNPKFTHTEESTMNLLDNLLKFDDYKGMTKNEASYALTQARQFPFIPIDER